MWQYRLRGMMLIVGVIAISLALGAYLERARQRAGGVAAPRAVAPKAVGTGGTEAFDYFIGAFY